MEDGDDDFGDLYADVEVEASSAMNAVPQFSRLQSVSDEIGKQDSVVEKCSDKEDRASDGGDDDEDDEDDLNIVLNSDDDNIGHGEGFTAARNNTILRSGELEDEDDNDLGREEFVGGKAAAKAGSGGDGINQSLIGGGKGVYNSHSQYKYVRSQFAAYASDLKGNGCRAAASYSSLRGDWEDNGCCPRSMGRQSGQRFSLPRSRTILDVNIDVFEQKPWMVPGADITDYFNYGLNEDSWKLYCNQVDEYRHREPMLSGIPASEPVQLTERKGRAIQVEDSIVERRSSMDVVRQLERDSDVIQINVHDPEEELVRIHNSGREASNHEAVGGDDDTDHLSFSTASEDESIGGNHQGMKIQAPKRSSNQRKSSNPATRGSEDHEINQHRCFRKAIGGSEETDEAIGISNNTKETAGEDTCTTDPSMLVAESSETEKSPESRCKAFEDGTYIDRRKFYSHESHPLTKSFTELTPSVKSGYHHSKRSDVKRKPGGHRYHARNSSSVHKNRNHGDSKPIRHNETDESYSRRLEGKRKPGGRRYHEYNSRTHGDSKPKPHYENDHSWSTRPGELRYHARHNRNCGVSKRKAHHQSDDSFPMFDNEGAYSTGDRDRLHAFDPYDEEHVSYLKESELPSDYYCERFSGHDDWDTSARNLHRKGCERYETHIDPFVIPSSEYYGERRKFIEDDKVMARNWCHNERELAVENTDFFTCEEFGWQNSEYPSYLKHKRGPQWKRRVNNMLFQSESEHDEVFLKRKYADSMQGGKFRRSLTYNGRERNCFEPGYVEHVAYTRWELRGPGRNKRRLGSPSVKLNNFFPKGEVDRDDHSEEPHLNNSWHCNLMQSNNLYGKLRGQWTKRCNDDGSFGGYSEPFARKDYTIDNDDGVDMGRTRQHWQSEMKWDEDANFCAEGTSFSFEEVSRCKMFDSEDGSEEPINHGHHKYNYKLREGTRRDKFERSSKLICEGSRDQPFRGSGDSHCSQLVDDRHAMGCRYEETREAKIEETSSFALGGSGDSRLVEEMIDDPHAEGCRVKQARDVLSDKTSNFIHGDSHEQPSLSCGISLDSHLVVGEGKSWIDDGLAIEEGQILMEAVRDDQNGKTDIEEARILEAMAKMKKRRARFKEPITARKKDSEATTKLMLLDSTKQERPPRKRRWGGS